MSGNISSLNFQRSPPPYYSSLAVLLSPLVFLWCITLSANASAFLCVNVCVRVSVCFACVFSMCIWAALLSILLPSLPVFVFYLLIDIMIYGFNVIVCCVVFWGGYMCRVLSNITSYNWVTLFSSIVPLHIMLCSVVMMTQISFQLGFLLKLGLSITMLVATSVCKCHKCFMRWN